MKNNLLEHIILYVLVACVTLIIATLARISAASMGFDNFTTFIVFIVVLCIMAIVYLSIHVVLQGLMLPWIGKGLSKFPYFRNKMTPTPNVKIKEIDREQIRNEHLQTKIEKFDMALKIALEYTQTTFAPYLIDANITLLCSHITLYAEQKELKNITPIKLDKQLTTIDIYHFGWNIWNHFQVSDQVQMARFLKTVFSHTLREVDDVETIKKKLKIFEQKCKIQIRENLSK